MKNYGAPSTAHRHDYLLFFLINFTFGFDLYIFLSLDTIIPLSVVNP